MPCLGEVRKVAQKQRQSRLRNVVATGGNVARSQIEGMRGRAMGMVHPQVPDTVFRGNCLIFVPASAEAAKQRVQRGGAARRSAAASVGDQPESLCVNSHQLQLMLALSVKIARMHGQTTEQFVVVEQLMCHEMHDLAFAFDHSLNA